MPSTPPSQDVVTLSHLRANATVLIEAVHRTHRPLVLTRHGRGAAVVLDMPTYRRLMEARATDTGAAR